MTRVLDAGTRERDRMGRMTVEKGDGPECLAP